MSRVSYGHTWWGAQWLQALAQIDFDNRLPRGRTYANRGAVRDLEVHEGHIRAHVQGSRPKPYVVDIHVPQVGAADAARLAERLAGDPGLIARLLNRELDPEVLKEAKALGIQVFPQRWKDLRMQCSCPDWAVPCKHLAAAIYLLSREIDADPYLVFKLRGIDLQTLLGRQGVAVDAEAERALPDGALALFEDDPESASPEPTHDPQALERIDFTAVPELCEPLWRLLPAQPVFHRGGDFRELAHMTVARIARAAQRQLDAPALAADTGGEAVPLPEGALRLRADAQAGLEVAGATLDGRALDTLPGLLAALAAVRSEDLPDLGPDFAAVHTLNLLALHLLARGAVVPQVYTVDARTLGLRWCAAELDATVRGLVAQAASALPPGLVQRRLNRRWVPLAARAQARVLLCALVDLYLRLLAADLGPPAKVGDGKAWSLFFGPGQVRVDGPGEGALAGSVHAWLARLHLARRRHVPVLRLDEAARGDGFSLSLAVADEHSTLEAPVPLAQVIAQPAFPQRMGVLRTVAMLAEFHPPLHDYVRKGARRALPVSTEELPALLSVTLPALRLMGIRTLMPRALERLLRPRLSMQVKAAAGAGAGSGLLNMDSLLSFEWKVAIGDELVSAAEFERLLGKAGGVVKFRGQYVLLDAAELASLRARLAQPRQSDGATLLRAALAGEIDGAPVGLNPAAARLVERLRREDEVPLPAGLQATLRPYQQRGYAWLWRNVRLGLGSVIADDMGLGKTLQVLALLLRLKQDGALREGRALVIVPTSLLTNWQKEAARFTPDLSVAVFHGAKRELARERPDVLLTTYGVARSEAAALKALSWRIVVIDEAQNIKNPGAAQSKAVRAIPAQSHVAMSGTPVENRLLEYWSIMDFAQRGYLGGPTHFAREYATPIQTHRDAAAAERLRRVMAPFLLRRLKSDKSIISDLPDKVEQDQFCTLSKAQAALYESVVREGMAAIAGQSDTFERQGLVLQLILALKQVCNHPAHYLKQGAADPAASGKAERLLDLLDEIGAAREKALVFTQFREMGELLARMLHARHGREPLFLHGGVSRAGRDRMVERFQEEPGQRVFLLSLKAGGTGLNLTAANHVVHFDLWWNPAVEAQATDRAYRIGQQRKVQVHRFITRGTFEERINEMIRAKRELAEMTVGSGETWIGQLPTAELKALFRLG
ncbi:SNF2-related protein [uncultured Azohydromonas sp.]|uniref:SNF2-related protein n=1 Tax=uncultured Azohydromonas sp. TaxID=487342 RepID=UPI002612F33D|nr:SNF2-related protein [uncultured Azohydromonas sp.]